MADSAVLVDDAEIVGSNFESVRPLIVDSQYEALSSHFLHTGRGRPTALPRDVTLNNRLLIQLHLLREEGQKSWSDINMFAQKLFPHASSSSFISMIRTAATHLKNLPLDEVSTFLSKTKDIVHVGTFSQEAGITREALLSGVPSLHENVICTNGLIGEIANFAKKEKYKEAVMLQWIMHICNLSENDMDKLKVRSKVKETLSKIQMLRKNAGKANGQEVLQTFLNKSFLLSASASASGSSRSSSSSTFTGSIDNTHTAPSAESVAMTEMTSKATGDTAPSTDSIAITEMTSEAAGDTTELAQLYEDMKRKDCIIKQQQDQLSSESEREQISTLNEIIKEKNKALQADTSKKEKLQTKMAELESKLQDAKRKLELKNEECKTLKASAVYKRLKRREAESHALRRQLLQVKSVNENTELSLRESRKKTHSFQKMLSNVRIRQGKLIKEKKTLLHQVRELEKQNSIRLPEDHGAVQECDLPELHLKDENGHFKSEAKICIMALVGENEIPAHRCGSVIKTVAKMFGARIPDGDLPSQRSALRFADQGHVVSKSHVAEVLTTGHRWDINVDGTSRSGKNYVGHQATTKDGSFSMGFTPVVSEDTSTLVDIAVQMLEELSDLCPEGEAQQNFVQMLLGLSGIMTDRAAVMKSFGRSLEAERQQLLQTDEGLEFLHCNAHFLLGLGAESKKALAEDEKEKGVLLGRDAQPGLSSYNSSDCSAYRYIWMACDCLGPRGDDKHGCRDCWEAYCLMVEKPSTVTSFRENRFNNLFQAAASLHYHQHDILECLSSYVPKKNKKIESVLADCESEVLDCHIITLGLLYFRITGPYWCLLGGSVHYLDFYIHVERLMKCLQEWQLDASPALQANCPPVFPDVYFPHNENILQSLLAINEEKTKAVKALLERASARLIQVTKRQLADFLPGGKYHNVQDEELRRKLDHSSITNLVGEQCFADLDFSLFKRRNASLHHHSTMSLLKRNKSVSSWLTLKLPAEQEELLKLSAKKAQSLREKHVQMEKDTIRKKQDLLRESRLHKEAAEERKRQQKMEVLEDLRPHHGPCSSPADVSHLLLMYRTSKDLKKALRAEILFQKLILEKKSPLLRVSGSVLKLANQLLQFFGGEVLEHLPGFQPAAKEMSANRRHHREVLASDTSEPSESDSEEPQDQHMTDAEPETSENNQEANYKYDDFNYSFTQEGEIIAVFYEDDFYIGEVTSVLEENEAVVNFLVKAKTGSGANERSVYRWPHPQDKWPISSTVVFASSLSLAPSSSSGRSFFVDKPEDLPGRYRAFKKYLFENLL